MKTLDNYFADWESHVFGYGYGSGEGHVLVALKAFMEWVPDDKGYNYEDLERVLGPAVAWLLINVLCHADIIEYGTSPRFAWLTPQGKALKSYLESKKEEELYEVTAGGDDRWNYCYPDHCNCQDEDCHNPFWQESKPRGNCRETHST